MFGVWLGVCGGWGGGGGGVFGWWVVFCWVGVGFFLVFGSCAGGIVEGGVCWGWFGGGGGGGLGVLGGFCCFYVCVFGGGVCGVFGCWGGVVSWGFFGVALGFFLWFGVGRFGGVLGGGVWGWLVVGCVDFLLGGGWGFGVFGSKCLVCWGGGGVLGWRGGFCFLVVLRGFCLGGGGFLFFWLGGVVFFGGGGDFFFVEVFLVGVGGCLHDSRAPLRDVLAPGLSVSGGTRSSLSRGGREPGKSNEKKADGELSQLGRDAAKQELKAVAAS